MKELMRNMKSNKGITIITLTVAVTILIIITGTLIYSAKDSIEIRKLNNMYNDIELLEDKVEAYYAEYGGIPTAKEPYTNIQFLYGNDGIQDNDDDVKSELDDGNYYVIDLVSLEGITSLNYGRDYEKIKDKTFNQTTDIYIINQVSHQIYYVRGVELEGKHYYTNEQKTEGNVDLKITVIDSIEDLVRFEQAVNAEDTFEGKKVFLTRNLDFEDNNSYDGSTVTINGTSYSLNGTNNLKTYLCKDESDENKTTGWTPIGNYSVDASLVFSGTFDGKGYEISNIYINSTSTYQGLFGYNDVKGNIKNITVTGKIKSTRGAAGIAGMNKGIIEKCINKCDIYAKGVNNISHAAGIASRNDSGIISKCINKGQVNGELNQCGGICGVSYGGNINNCINEGNIKIDDGWNVGGIIGLSGYIDDTHSDFMTVENCYNIGNVSGNTSSGGNVGGIIGNNYTKGILKNCYNIGDISGKDNLGGVIGKIESGGTHENCYYLVGKASYGIGNTSSDENAEPRAEIVMKTSAFVDLLGLSNWKIVENKNNGYPILRWQEGTETQVAWYNQKGLLLHYDGIENTSNGHSSSATTWYDLSGKGNSGTLYGNTWGTNYLSFDGNDDYIDLANNLIGLFKNNFTMEMVIKFNESGRDVIIGNYSANAANKINIEKGNLTGLNGRIYYNSGAIDHNTDSDIYEIGTIQNINFILNKSTNTFSFYKNSIENYSFTNTSFATNFDFSGVKIGRDSRTGETSFGGTIYSIRIYNRILTADEITTNYNLDKSRFGF